MRSSFCISKYLLILGLLTPGFSVVSLQTPTVLAQPVTKIAGDRLYQAARQIIASGSLFAAKSKLQQALKIYQQLGDRQGQYNAQIELARIDYHEAKYQQANSKLRLAQAGNYSIKDGRASTLAGLIALELGNYREALSRLRVGYTNYESTAAAIA